MKLRGLRMVLRRLLGGLGLAFSLALAACRPAPMQDHPATAAAAPMQDHAAPAAADAAPMPERQVAPTPMPEPAAAPAETPTAVVPAAVDFGSQVRPILEKRCQPCHFEGGKMYARLPFDKPETIRSLGSKLFTRITDDSERAAIQAFLDQSAAPK